MVVGDVLEDVDQLQAQAKALRVAPKACHMRFIEIQGTGKQVREHVSHRGGHEVAVALQIAQRPKRAQPVSARPAGGG